MFPYPITDVDNFEIPLTEIVQVDPKYKPAWLKREELINPELLSEDNTPIIKPPFRKKSLPQN